MDDTSITDAKPDEPVANTAAVTENPEPTPEHPHLSPEEIEEATKDGLKEAVTEKAKFANGVFDDLPGEPPSMQYFGSDESQGYASLLDLGVDQFEKLVSTDAGKEGSIDDTKVHGLLALERNGQNRTPYVKAMMKRLDLKKEDLPGGGPSYTNDVSSISEL